MSKRTSITNAVNYTKTCDNDSNSIILAKIKNARKKIIELEEKENKTTDDIEDINLYKELLNNLIIQKGDIGVTYSFYSPQPPSSRVNLQYKSPKSGKFIKTPRGGKSNKNKRRNKSKRTRKINIKKSFSRYSK